MTKRIKKAKLLSSNFTVQEQKKYIRQTIESLKPTKREVRFLNNFYEETNSTEFSVLKKSKSKKAAINIPAPNIMMNIEVLKEIYKQLKKNPLNRLFTIRANKDKSIILSDFLFGEIIEIKDAITFIEKEEIFTIDSKLFYFFRLNEKTLAKKCMIYINETSLIYENNRGKESELYLIPRNGENNK